MRAIVSPVCVEIGRPVVVTQTAIEVSQEPKLLPGQKRSTREEGREPEEIRPVKCGTPVPITVVG